MPFDHGVWAEEGGIAVKVTPRDSGAGVVIAIGEADGRGGFQEVASATVARFRCQRLIEWILEGIPETEQSEGEPDREET